MYKKNLSYSVKLSALLNSATGSIFLDAVYQEYLVSRNKFIMFLYPNLNSPEYETGKSWKEKIYFYREDYLLALKLIGTPVKDEADSYRILSEIIPVFSIEKKLLNRNKLLTYWQQGQVTWYKFNIGLFENCMEILDKKTWKEHIGPMSEELRKYEGDRKRVSVEEAKKISSFNTDFLK